MKQEKKQNKLYCKVLLYGSLPTRKQSNPILTPDPIPADIKILLQGQIVVKKFLKMA